MSNTSAEIFRRAIGKKLGKELGEHLRVYHYAPEGVEELVSPEYALNILHKPELYRNMTWKYRDRLVGDWGIYPGRDPESLTDEEVYAGLEKVRGKGGNNRIYFFRYKPDEKLGPRMKAFLEARKAFELDLDDPKVQEQIKNIDWGREGSTPEGKALDEAYYRSVEPKTVL